MRGKTVSVTAYRPGAHERAGDRRVPDPIVLY